MIRVYGTGFGLRASCFGLQASGRGRHCEFPFRGPASRAPIYTSPMRYLRMLSNSLLAGALGAAYLTILLLQLNPQVPLASSTVWRWYATLGAFYGTQLAVVFYVLMLLRAFFGVEIFSPGWISVRLLAWLSSVAAAAAATLMWLNLRGFTT